MANIKDVAKLAGVSISTVSRAVNQTAGVAPEKYQAVQRAMKELHYHPNTFAQALVNNKSNILGLVVGNLSEPFFGLLMQGVEKVARQYNKQLLISVGHENSESEKVAIQSIINQRCDALIVHSRYLTDFQLMELLDQQAAAVVINRLVPDIKERCISIDNRQLAKTAMDHLLDKGHKDIAAIFPEDHLDDTEQRYQGYQDALAGRGIIFDSNNTIRTKCSFEGGYRAIDQLIERDIPTSALFVNSTTMAAGCLKALQKQRIRAPSDLSVIAIGDGVPTDFLTPKLTIVDYPVELIGTTAAKLSCSLASGADEIMANHFDSQIVTGNSVSIRS